MKGLISVAPVSRWVWVWAASTAITGPWDNRMITWSKLAGGTTMTRWGGIWAAKRTLKKYARNHKRRAERSVYREVEY